MWAATVMKHPRPHFSILQLKQQTKQRMLQKICVHLTEIPRLDNPYSKNIFKLFFDGFTQLCSWTFQLFFQKHFVRSDADVTICNLIYLKGAHPCLWTMLCALCVNNGGRMELSQHLLIHNWQTF